KLIHYITLHYYIGIIIPGLRFVFVKEGSIRGWVGVEDFGAGAAHLPKYVVLPLKALMLKDNFASGAVSAAAEKSWVKGIL
ncbi:hypothetical protein EBV26_17995, partial [bacterium]|nr:hypothetical protein [bacterium]